MDDMDSLLKELEQSVQKEISQKNVKSFEVDNYHAQSDKPDKSTKGKENNNKPTSGSHKKEEDITTKEGSIAQVLVDEALIVNVDPPFLVSPVINIVQPSPLSSESQAYDHVLLGSHLGFRREASTSSLREEESHDLDDHTSSDFSKNLSFTTLEDKTTPGMPCISNVLLVNDELKRCGSSKSVLDEGEDDEDEMVKALEMLDRGESRERSEETDDGIVMKEISDVIDVHKDIVNDFTVSDNNQKDVPVSLPHFIDPNGSSATVDVSIDLQSQTPTTDNITHVQPIVSDYNIQLDCDECQKDETLGVTDVMYISGTDGHTDMGIVETTVRDIVQKVDETVRTLTDEPNIPGGSRPSISNIDDDKASSDIPIEVLVPSIYNDNDDSSPSESFNSTCERVEKDFPEDALEALGNDNEGLTPEMEAEFEELEKELRSQGLLDDEIDGIKGLVKEELDLYVGEPCDGQEKVNILKEGQNKNEEPSTVEENTITKSDCSNSKSSGEDGEAQNNDGNSITSELDGKNGSQYNDLLNDGGGNDVENPNLCDIESQEKLSEKGQVVQSVEELDPDSQTQTVEGHGDLESSRMCILPEQPKPLSVIASTHTVGNVGTDLRLTESELQLGKVKPNWIKDDEYKKCMICLAKFTIVNRRHHCRCCGRVLCSECCSIRRKLFYMEENEKAQRVCQPCNLTLDRIEVYEKMRENTQPRSQTEPAESEELSDLPAGPSTSTEISTLARRKSVLKQKRSESECTQSPPDNGDLQRKRSVRFLDGIAPGTELIRSEEADGQDNTSSKQTKPRRRSSRRLREHIAQEEGKLLLTDGQFYTIGDTFTGELKMITMEEILDRFNNGFSTRLVIKRNIHLCINQNSEENNVISLYTSGLNTLGVEEILIAYTTVEKKPSFPMGLCRLLARFSAECLKPRTEQLDDINGIRFCGLRMANSVEIKEDEATEGLDSFKLIFFAPYMDQEIRRITYPNGAFRVGVFIKEAELPIIKALPMRVLTRLGMISDVFPFPVINDTNRSSVFTHFADLSQLSSSTILTMFHDFRSNSYQMPYIATSCVIIDEKNTKVLLPAWAKEQMKTILNSQMNLLAWACDINEECDSILTCEHLGSAFQTRIFMKESDRNCIGVSFVAFSTGHKGGDNEFSQTLVEDGVVIRFTVDTLESIQKKLQNGDGIELESNGVKLKIEWVENGLLNVMGPIKSPIDGIDIRGYIQYGLTLERAIHSNILFQNSRHHALRLGSAIRLVSRKLEPQLQSHFFDACEQLTMWIRTTLENYVPLLIGIDIKSIEIRLHASQDNVGFQLANWTGLEEVHAECIGVLSEKILPILYQILASNTGDFNVELHLPIISVYPVPKDDEPDD